MRVELLVFPPLSPEEREAMHATNNPTPGQTNPGPNPGPGTPTQPNPPAQPSNPGQKPGR